MTRPVSFEQACAMYVHRYTLDHVPRWAQRPREGGTYFAPQYRSDREWYTLTRFPGEDGWIGLPGDTNCYSTGQTWPLGTELDGPLERCPECGSYGVLSDASAHAVTFTAPICPRCRARAFRGDA